MRPPAAAGPTAMAPASSRTSHLVDASRKLSPTCPPSPRAGRTWRDCRRIPWSLRQRPAILWPFAGEQHDRRIIGDRVEERVGREVDLALGAHRGDPADRTWCDYGLEGIVRKSVIVLCCVIKHVTRVCAAGSSALMGVSGLRFRSIGGRGRSSGGSLGRPIWTKPAMRSFVAEPERIEDAAVIGVPFGYPVRARSRARARRARGSWPPRPPRAPAPIPEFSRAGRLGSPPR